jgi:uroporphyrinogen decarboxylase
VGTVEQWDSRRRVFAAIEHLEPDRVPINFGGCAQTTLLECPPEAPAVTRLYARLGVSDYETPSTGAIANQVYNMDPRVMDRFGSDFRLIMPNGGAIEHQPDGSKTILGMMCGARAKRVGLYDDIFEYPLRECTTISQIKEYHHWPTDEDFKNLSTGKVEEIRALKRKSGKVILEDGYKAFPHLMYSMLCGMDKWMIDMKTDPDFYFALSDRLFEIGLRFVDHWIGPIGSDVDIVSTYDDLGTQNGPLISHDDYVRFLKPYEKRMIEHIKKRTEAKIYRHSCGSIYEFIPDLIEIGVDILNPVQPLAKNMEPSRLKAEFGKDITFFGGIDTQELLYKSPAEVKKGVRDALCTYGQGGGYILGSSHNIEPDTPIQNILALFEAAMEYGRYPLGS